MMAKFITTASDSEPAVMFRSVIVAEPASILDTQQLYAPAVALAEATFKIKTSLVDSKVLVSVNVTFVVAASAAPSIVICPLLLLRVTPVDLLVAWVTEPCAALL